MATTRPDHQPDTQDDAEPPAPARRSRTVLLVRLALGGVLFVIAAAIAGFVVAAPDQPGDDSVAAGLARDMIDHHAQAVDMASIVQGRTQDTAIRFLATDIVLTQTNQMGQMQGWLNEWGLSLGRTGRPMEWMTSHSHGRMDMGSASGKQMPGMATQAEVNRLRTLPAAQADIQFLKLMIAHHRGGVSMAQTALDETDEPVVVRLCQTIVKTQQNEITQMSALLKEREAQTGS